MRRPRRPDTPVADDHVSETDLDDAQSVSDADENDENRPLGHALVVPRHASSLLILRTPLSHSRASQDTPLRDITDQFFHPPSPSPARISKLKRLAPHTAEPPRRPKKPKSLAYPADPPNWLYSRSPSSLPPSSPLPPSTANVDPADHPVRHPATARRAYYLGTPSRASDSDPFGFVAVERALKAKRVPHKPPPPTIAAKSPPRSTVLPSAPAHIHASVRVSFSQLDAPVPTNNEDLEDLYADDPIAGPSHGHVSVAPLLMMSNDRPVAEINATRAQPMFSDPLCTPRKHKHRASPTPDGDLDSNDSDADVPSSPSPVKPSVRTGTHARHSPGTARPSHTPVLKLTRAQTRAASAGTGKPPATHASRGKTSRQRIPTPSSTRPSATPRQSTAPPTPVLPRRSTRQAAVGAMANLRCPTTTSDGEGGDGGSRMKLRPRSAKTNQETKTTRKHPPSRSKASTRSPRATTAKPVRGRPRGKSNAKDAKGKGKSRPLKNVLDLSDDTRERYEKERRERLEYFKHLEGYQMQKENVYIV